MKYLEFKPSEALAEYIQLIWILESETAEAVYPKECILPDGIIEMGFISIRFYPWGAYHFFSTPIKDFTDNSIDEIANQFQISRKQLERKFASSLGTSPKVFSRTCRFLSLCHNLKHYEGRNLSEFTYECGYFDQSHFIKEFKAYSGFTPKEYFAKNNVVFADL